MSRIVSVSRQFVCPEIQMAHCLVKSAIAHSERDSRQSSLDSIKDRVLKHSAVLHTPAMVQHKNSLEEDPLEPKQ